MEHPLKVLLVASDVNTIGGIQQYNRNVLAGIRESGAEARLVEVRGTTLGAKASFVARIVREAFFWRPDVVWCGHVNFAPLIRGLRSWLGFRYLVPLYGIDAIKIEGARVGALEAADLLTPIAHHTAANLLRQIPGVKDKIFLIPNSVDGERFTIRPRRAELVERYGLAGRKVILTVARLNPDEHKGYDRVIDALPLVLERVPDAVHLLVGGGQDLRVQEAIERRGVRDRVVLAGAIPAEELVDHYNLCDVYAMPSKLEGFAIVFLEALACGKPVVASAGYGCREALLDGELGLTVDPDRREELAVAIVRALTDLPESMADPAKLRARTLEHYDLRAFKKRVAEAVRRTRG